MSYYISGRNKHTDKILKTIASNGNNGEIEPKQHYYY